MNFIKLSRFRVLILVLCVCCLVPSVFGDEHPEFGGLYEDLDSEQKRLVENWVERYNSVTGQQLRAQPTYDQLSLSARTTFEAVTHALLTSKLTDAADRPIGNALQLVRGVDTVHGKIKGARGDLQFRMYAALIPDARDRLERSQEFKRERDNTIFHKGYPLNYRQQGGVPSIQVSMSRDERRADIDVDYRSSKFPLALFNGHLTAANSDVRAGNNHIRHENRWSGLLNWWENFFALPFLREDSAFEESNERGLEGIPLRPRSGRRVEEAAFDFFHSWLVERKPELSLAYVSARAFQCADFGEGEIDYGMAPFKIVTSMRQVNELVGEIDSVKSVATGIRLSHPELRVVDQPHHASFVLYDMSESYALSLDCNNRDLSPDEIPEGSSRIYGRHFGTVLHLKVSDLPGETMVLLWEQEGRDWKIVAYEVEPEAKATGIPDNRDVTEDEVRRVEGDPRVIAASTGFLESWLIEGNIDRAMEYFATEAIECVSLFEEEELSSAAAVQTLRSGLEETRRAIGTPETLDEAIEAIEPVNPDVFVVNHADERAYTLASVPGYVGSSYGCGYRLGGGEMLSRPEQPHYGDYYVTEVMLELIAGDPAVFALLWSRKARDWKIVAYDIISP